MLVSRNEFVTAFSFALDYLEIGVRKNITNHNKRVALIATYLGTALGLGDAELFDLYAYAVLHDNGITNKSYNAFADNGRERLETALSHCIVGEENLTTFPFSLRRENVIRYHHEAYDGTGYFGIAGEDIPQFSQIIALADKAEILYRSTPRKKDILAEIMELRGRIFSARLCDAFSEIAQNVSFWLSLDDRFIETEISRKIPSSQMELTVFALLPIADILRKIIDAKSPFTGEHSKGLVLKVGVMSDYYGFDEEKKTKLLIAASLHDIGKLVIPNAIIDKPGKLTAEEFDVIKSHTYYTRKVIESVNGFEDIADWASNHHEKLNGKGYPYGLHEDQLSFEARLVACLDIYQALTEDRPYRTPLSHEEASRIIGGMADNGEISREIVSDISSVCGDAMRQAH